MRAGLAMGLLALATGATHAQPACRLAPEAGEQVQAGPVQAAWRVEPAPIVVGRPFVLWVSLCPAPAQLVRVDATMPEHRHGMNYRPTLHKAPDGRWRAEGLLWHMAGRWELRLDVDVDGGRHTLRQSVTLP